jgi:uncharacterized delta-60 repeat protein
MFAPFRRSIARTALLVATIAAAALVAAGSTFATSGALDTTYGTGGKATVPTPTGTSRITDAIKLANGDLIAVGSRGAAGSSDAFVVKLSANGAIDPTFGGGTLAVDLGDETVARTISAATDGGFYVGGDVTSGTDMNAFIVKVTGSGSLDSTWAVGGAYVFSDPAEATSVGGLVETSAPGDVAYAVRGGSNWNLRVGVIRDTTQTFVSAPNTSQTVTGTSNDEGEIREVAGLVATAPDEFLLVATGTRDMTFPGQEGSGEITLAAFEEDVNSGTNPAALTRVAYSTPVAISDVAQFADGDLLLSGSTTTTTSGPARGTLWRFNADATPETTFGTSGQLVLASASQPWVANSATILADGRYYVTGDVGTTQVRTIRLLPSGEVDTSFGVGGIADRVYGSASSRSNKVFADVEARPTLLGAIDGIGAAYRLDLNSYAAPNTAAITHNPNFNIRLQNLTITFPVTNAGPDATGVAVDVDIPLWLEGTAFTSSHGGTTTPVADGTGVTWTIPTLAAGATATLSVTGKPGDSGTLKVGSIVTSQTAVRSGAAPVAQSHSIVIYGAATPRNDTIYGTPQRDVIDSLAGDDKVFGLGGNDRLLGNLGDDRIDGGAGNDQVDGGEGDDNLKGAGGNDRMFGKAGVDYLSGGSGIDYLNGGIGNDRVFGGAGNDSLIGQQGRDYLSGGPGRDKLHGDGGKDRIYGGSGGDWLYGGDSNDYLRGNTGDDWLRGYMGNDTIHGDAGNDLLNGGAGTDRLFAGTGNDIIRADDGKPGDTVNCGSGWDLVYANHGDSIHNNCEFVKYDVPNGTPLRR